MVRPLSLHLRTRIAAALKDGMTVRAAAERFGVSAATAVHVGQLDRSGKGLVPAKIDKYVKPHWGAAADAVRQRLQVKSDWTVGTLSAGLQSVGIKLSHDTVWRFVRSEGKTLKKTLVASQQDRPKGQGSGCGGRPISIGLIRTVSS